MAAPEAAGYEYTGFIIFVKFLGLCSMTGSSFILRDVYYRLRSVSASSRAGGSGSWRRKVTLTQSVIFCLSVGDFFAAFFVQFLSTWMVPSSIEVSLASGTVASCTAQGYFGMLFYSLSVFSNASLAVAYSLIVRFGWRDDDKHRYRMPFVLVPIVTALALSIAPLPGKNYNYNGAFYCDITESPLGCNYPDSNAECTRGANARYILLGVNVIPYMVAFAIIIAAVLLLIHSVLTQERRMDRYRREGMPVNRSMTAKTTRQGIYYIVAFGLAWIPWYIYALMEFNQSYIPEALAVVHLTTKALQGVFNASVYFRPKYKSERISNPDVSRFGSVLRVLRIPAPAINCCRAKSEPKQNATKTGADVLRFENEKHKEPVKEEKSSVEEERKDTSGKAAEGTDEVAGTTVSEPIAGTV